MPPANPQARQDGVKGCVFQFRSQALTGGRAGPGRGLRAERGQGPQCLLSSEAHTSSGPRVMQEKVEPKMWHHQCLEMGLAPVTWATPPLLGHLPHRESMCLSVLMDRGVSKRL